MPISGWVWEDWNDDGIQDPDEISLRGIPVTLLREVPAKQGPRRRCGRRAPRASGPRLEPVATIVTNLLGEYRFLVPQGRRRYRVLVAPPPGYETVLRDQGGDDGLDSDIDPVSRRSDRLEARRDHVIDIGLSPLTAIGDRVWLDENANGLQDLDEPGVPDVFVLLYRFDRAGNAFVFDDLLLTDAGGGFGFAPRRPGLYHLRFLPSDGHAFTRFNVGDDPDVDSDALTDTGATPDIHLPDDGMPDGLLALRRLMAALARALAGLGRGLGAGGAAGGGALIVGGGQPGGAGQVGALPGLAGFTADTWDAGLIPDERTATTSPVIEEGPIVCSTGRGVRDPQVTISDVRALLLPNGGHAFMVRMDRALSDDHSFAVVLFVRTPLGVISFKWEIHDGAFRIGRMDPETGELIEDEAGDADEIFHQRELGIVGFLLEAGTIPDDADMVIVRGFHSPRARATTRCHQTPAFELPRP
ncbi:hypothetical protein BH23CHL8_BH23CHL8_27520 [soil metagenome]